MSTSDLHEEVDVSDVYDPPFHAWLRNLRTQRNLTQDQLADAINRSGGTVTNGSVICHWESGARRPNGGNLLAMCLALDIGIAEAQRALAVPLTRDLTSDNSEG